MIITSDTGLPPLFLEKLRSGGIESLPNDAPLVCEDGSYNQSIIDEVKICWHVALGDTELLKGGRFLADDEIEDFKKDYEEVLVIKLTTPVLKFTYTAFKVR